jgi:hypothetical protein
MTEAEKLALRCEAASGPCRELDVAIFRALGAPVPFQFANKLVALAYDETEQCYFAPVGDMRVRYEPPAYTASIDVAETLMPSDCGFVMHSPIGKPPSVALQFGREDFPAPKTVDGWGDYSKAATRPLALCAAALRARAQTLTGDHAR